MEALLARYGGYTPSAGAVSSSGRDSKPPQAASTRASDAADAAAQPPAEGPRRQAAGSWIHLREHSAVSGID